MFLKVCHKNGGVSFYEAPRIVYRPIEGTYDRGEFTVGSDDNPTATVMVEFTSESNWSECYILNESGKTVDSFHSTK